MIRKLESTGISGKVLALFKNCSPDRKQRVTLPGFASELSKFLAGFSQGSIPSSLYQRHRQRNGFYMVAYGCSLMTLVRGIISVHYYTGSKETHIWHTRLRTDCSSLNNDFFAKSIPKSPFCSCGSGIDDINVYLSCILFNEQRVSLLNEVNQYRQISLNLLFCGDDTVLPYASNERIFQNAFFFTTSQLV